MKVMRTSSQGLEDVERFVENIFIRSNNDNVVFDDAEDYKKYAKTYLLGSVNGRKALEDENIKKNFIEYGSEYYGRVYGYGENTLHKKAGGKNLGLDRTKDSKTVYEPDKEGVKKYKDVGASRSDLQGYDTKRKK